MVNKSDSYFIFLYQIILIFSLKVIFSKKFEYQSSKLVMPQFLLSIAAKFWFINCYQYILQADLSKYKMPFRFSILITQEEQPLFL
jgi:hypothetical protein